MHRDLAKIYHPDEAGGDNLIMQKINSERDKLELTIKQKNDINIDIPQKFYPIFHSYQTKSDALSGAIKKIRKFVKINYPDCKFICTHQKHIIHLSLIEAPQEIYTTSGTDSGYIKGINNYLKDGRSQNNKVCLTEYGRVIILTVYNFIEEHRREFGRFYINFDIGLQRGKLRKPFKIVKKGK